MPTTAYYAIALSLSQAVSLAVAFLAWRRRSVPGSIYFALMMLAVAVWCAAAAIEAVSADQSTKIIWSQISYLGVCAAPPLFLLFALKYWRPEIHVRRLYLACIWIVPLATILIAATNDLHHLLWSSFAFASPDSNILIYGHGPWFWINVVYSYLLMLAGIVLLSRVVIGFPQLYRHQALAVLAAAILPLAGNALYVFGGSPLKGLDIAPMTFSVTGLILALGIIKLQLFDLVPSAREKMLQHMDLGMMVLDGKARVVDFNSAAERITGEKIEIGQQIEGILERWREMLPVAVEAGEKREFLLANREPQLWVEVGVFPLMDRIDRLTGHLITLQDITERKQTEDALRQSEMRFRQMVDLLPEAVCEIDTSGNLLFGNRAAFVMTGYDKKDFEKGLNILSMIAQEDRDRALGNIASMLDGEALGADEYTLLRNDGSSFPAVVHIANILDASGNTVGFRGIVIDITERRLAEEARQRLVAIVESSHDAIIGKTLDGMITSWNKGAEERYGYTADEILGRSISIIVPEERSSEVPQILEKIGRGEPVIDYESERVTKDGRRITVLLTISPIKDPSGKVVGASTIAQDITERKKAEEKVRQAAEEWQSTFDSISDMVSIQDRDYKLIRVNKAYSDAVGMKMEDIIGRNCHEVVHNASSHISNCPHHRTLETKKAMTEEVFEPKLGAYLEVSTSPIFDKSGEVIGSVHIAKNITERKRADGLIRIRLSLLEFAATHSLEELLEKTLDEVGALTDSPIGFYHFVEEDQKTLSLQAWSTRTVKEFCKAEGKGMHYGIDQAGVWVDCVREKRPVIHNDYSSLPHRKGLPQGHAPVIRELVVPIMRDDSIVAILGIGNKPADYTDKDIEIVSYLADVAWEITERKRAEEALQESESRFRTLVANVPAAIFRCASDPEWTMAYISRTIEEITGYPSADFIDNSVRGFGSIIDHADREMVEKTIQEALSRRRSYDVDYRINTADGSVKWVHENGQGSFDEDGSVIHIDGVIVDISEHKRLEEALRESEKKFKDLAEQLPQTIVEIDTEGRFTYVNRYGYESTGYTEEDVEKGIQAIDMFVPEQRDMATENIGRILAGEQLEGHEYKLLRKDGTEYTALIYTNTVMRDGNPLGVRAIVVDISERKRIEQMKTDFVAFISHQLRTPVAGLMGYIDNMLDGVTGELNGKQIDYLSEMRDVCARNNRLIADLLYISRLERGVLAAQINPVVLRESVDTAVKEHRKSIEEKGLALNLVEIDRDIVVLADSDKLIEVLKNLIHNAFKFTKEGSIDIEISSRGSEGIVRIEDSGVGMSEEVVKDLFKKEKVFGGAVAVGGGAGLGLYIAKGFMKLQGGDVTVESVAGKGSTFTVSIPKK